MTTHLQVYKATGRDQGKIVQLLNEARRSFAAFGLEDLPHLLARGNCTVAGTDEKLWGFACVALNGSGWAFLRGAAIVNGWRTDDALAAVLQPLQDRLREGGATHLAAYGTALWLVPALQRAGFERREWIATLERHPRPLTLEDSAEIAARPVVAGDVGQLGTLDAAAFAPPFQLESGELIELMVTNGHFSVAQMAGSDRLAGYGVADVIGDQGHITRLCVDPQLHGRGIGRRLLNGALAYCSENGARTVTINTQDSNQASLRLYEGVGFRRVGRRVPLLVYPLQPVGADEPETGFLP